MEATLKIPDEIVKHLQGKGVPEVKIPAVYSAVVEEILGKYSHYANDFFYEWEEQNYIDELIENLKPQ